MYFESDSQDLEWLSNLSIVHKNSHETPLPKSKLLPSLCIPSLSSTLSVLSLFYISGKSERDHKNLIQNEEMPWVLGQADSVNFPIWGKLLNLSETQFSSSLKLEYKPCLHKFFGMMKWRESQKGEQENHRRMWKGRKKVNCARNLGWESVKSKPDFSMWGFWKLCIRSSDGFEGTSMTLRFICRICVYSSRYGF